MQHSDKDAQRLFNWTHSWTVHSGIVSGIWPLFTRLQSKSSPIHTQGGGHVLVLAPHPRCSLKNRIKTTANLAKLRACVEEHIFLATQENTPLQFYLQMKRNQSKDWEITNTNPKIWCWLISTVDPYIQSLAVPRIEDVKCKRKALFWKLPIPVEKL